MEEPNKNEIDETTVELVVKNASNLAETKEEIHDKKSAEIDDKKRYRIGFMVFIICCVDMITLYYMSDIHNQATSMNCIYLSNLLYVIIPILCLLATVLLALSAWNLYFRRNGKTMAIIIYLAAIIIHSILFWYENILISDIEYYNNNHNNTRIGINKNIEMIRYALTIKGIIFTLAFIITFIYNLFLRILLSSRRCIMMTTFSISIILVISMILFITDTYRYNGVHIHSIAALFGLLHIKCHGCAAGSSSKMNTHHLTTTYTADAKVKGVCCPEVCKGGFFCQNGCNGCCECNCGSGACCVIFTFNVFKCRLGSNGEYPDSLCCSFCGLSTCFCCDPGGCCGYCCCSYDAYTWC